MEKLKNLKYKLKNLKYNKKNKFKESDYLLYKQKYIVKLLKIHTDDHELYFTIKFSDGKERQTLINYLKEI
tara:strand:+ start:1065 stop:1277 length:213 start_codon:yes stop_codon:yes gene_type:complete